MQVLLYFCLMHVNVQLRFNPSTGQEAPYYRLKESYRDVRGNVHSFIVLNVGFEPSLTPLQVKRIAWALTDRFQNRNNVSLFQKETDQALFRGTDICRTLLAAHD